MTQEKEFKLFFDPEDIKENEMEVLKMGKNKLDTFRAKLFMLYPLAEIGREDMFQAQLKDVFNFLRKHNFTDLELEALKIFAQAIQ